MKLEENNREVITNTNNKHDFRIQANAKMFEILSSRIYTYKIAAIVREISCNAYDAHVESGKKDVPFRVVLPNDLHPYFEIEDFGVGLSEEQVYDVYTEYGNSTKTDSNEVIGALGLGSKTPFAYTTSFTIQTRKDGVECLFNAYIGDNGAPSATLLRKRDTTESNGVKIKVPVKSGQEDLFRHECQFILSFFPTRPEVVGNSMFDFNVEHEQVDRIQEGKLTVARIGHVRSELYRSKRLYAVMGTVCYPISLSDIVEMGEHQFKYLERVVLNGDNNNAAFLKFEIGDLEVSASREGLSIEEGKPTKDILVQVFKQAIDALIKEDGQLIADAEHPNEALSILVDKYGDVLPLVAGQFRYKGKSLDKLVKRDYMSPYDERYYHIGSRSLWSNRSQAMNKRIRIGGLELIERGYVILNANKAKTRGWQKYTRQVARQCRGKIVVATESAWSDHQINRFQKYLGIKAEEIFVLEDLKEEDRQNRPQPTQKAKVKRPPKKVEEVTACSFVLTASGCEYKRQDRHNIDDLKSRGYNVVWATKRRLSPYDTIEYSVDNRMHVQSTYMFAKYHVFLKDTIILLANSKNEKSIDENKVPSLSSQMEWIRLNKREEIEALARQLSWLCIRDNKLQFSHQLIEVARSVESPAIDPDVYQMYEDAIANTEVIRRYNGTHGSAIFNEMLDQPIEVGHQINDTVRDIKKRYPMTTYVNQYMLEPNDPVDPDTARVIQYMKLVDSQDDQSQYKLTA